MAKQYLDIDVSDAAEFILSLSETGFAWFGHAAACIGNVLLVGAPYQKVEKRAVGAVHAYWLNSSKASANVPSHFATVYGSQNLGQFGSGLHVMGSGKDARVAISSPCAGSTKSDQCAGQVLLWNQVTLRFLVNGSVTNVPAQARIQGIHPHARFGMSMTSLDGMLSNASLT